MRLIAWSHLRAAILVFGVYQMVSFDNSSFQVPTQSIEHFVPRQQQQRQRRITRTRQQVADNIYPAGWLGASRGVIIFFHVQKTGGTTLNFNMRRLDGVVKHNFVMGNRWNATRHKISQRCAGINLSGSPETLFLELHFHVPTLIRLQDNLRQWRADARTNNVPFFVFSIVREPLDHAISAFNHVYGQTYRGKKHTKTGEFAMTDAGFVAKWAQTPRNIQCIWFRDGWEYARKTPREHPVSAEDCRAVQAAMTEHLDWLGVTDRYQETSDLILKLLGQEDHVFERALQNSHWNKKTAITKDMLQQSTIDDFQESSLLDYELYEFAKKWPKPKII